ncbi:MAG: glycine cleavage system protein H, partial [Anaerolineales bacterium]
RRGESVGTIEAAKMTGDIVAPITGLLIDRNEQAVGDPSVVNRDPYGEGWLVAIQPRAWEKDAAELVSGAAIPEWVDAEIERYRAEGWID